MYIHGRYSFVDADVKQWVDWGIDYLKYDWSPNDLHYTQEMHDALAQVWTRYRIQYLEQCSLCRCTPVDGYSAIAGARQAIFAIPGKA